MATGFKSNAGMQINRGNSECRHHGIMMITPFSLETKPKNTPVATAHPCYQWNLLAKPVKYYLSLNQ